MILRKHTFVLLAFLLHGIVSARRRLRRTKSGFRLGKTNNKCWEPASGSKLGTTYLGHKAKTKSGITCQRWDQTRRPHKIDDSHKLAVSKIMKGKNPAHNYCRQADDDSEGPWCYTTKRTVERESCGIPRCQPKHFKKNCIDMNDPTGQNYVGPNRKTVGGKRCAAWNQEPPSKTPHTARSRRQWKKNLQTVKGMQTRGGKGNTCRNPDDDAGGIWCYTKQMVTVVNNEGRKMEQNWDYCEPPLVCRSKETNAFEPTCGIACPLGFEKCGFHDEAADIPAAYKIIDGINAKKGQWPWQVGLYHKRAKIFCGASIINKWFVLTAAHCVTSPTSGRLKFRTKEIRANIGWYDKKKVTPKVKRKFRIYGKDSIPIRAYHIHKDWDPRVIHYDIAVLQLNRPIKYPMNADAGGRTLIRPACLSTPNFDRRLVLNTGKDNAGRTNEGDAHECYSTGFGTTNNTEGHWDPNKLMMAEIKPYEMKKCNRVMKEQFLSSQLCGFNELNNKDTCQGDSGGPYVCRNHDLRSVVATQKMDQFFLTGVTSWGYNCGQGTPGVYTRVSEFIDWIKDIVKKSGKGVGVQTADDHM